MLKRLIIRILFTEDERYNIETSIRLNIEKTYKDYVSAIYNPNDEYELKIKNLRELLKVFKTKELK